MDFFITHKTYLCFSSCFCFFWFVFNGRQPKLNEVQAFRLTSFSMTTNTQLCVFKARYTKNSLTNLVFMSCHWVKLWDFPFVHSVFYKLDLKWAEQSFWHWLHSHRVKEHDTRKLFLTFHITIKISSNFLMEIQEMYAILSFWHQIFSFIFHLDDTRVGPSFLMAFYHKAEIERKKLRK